MKTIIATPKPGDKFLNDAGDKFVVLKKVSVQEQTNQQVYNGYGYQNQTITHNVEKWLCRNLKTGKEGHWSMTLGTKDRPLLIDEGPMDKLSIKSLTALGILGLLGYTLYKRELKK